MGLLSGLKWYDYIWFPWTVTKWTINQFKSAEPPKPGRTPQTSCYGRPIPIVYGMTRITGNMIDMEEFTYYTPEFQNARVALIALCEGEIDGIARIWRGPEVATYPAWAISLKPGTRPTQAAITEPPIPAERAIGYPGVAYAYSNFPRTAAQIAHYSWEVRGLLYDTGGTDGDADPAQIIPDLLGTTSYYGAQFDKTITVATGRDGNVASSYTRYVAQAGLWLSVACTEQKPASEHLQDICDATNSSALWTEGKLEIVPLADEAIGTFSPCVTIRYNLTSVDLLRDGDADAVEIIRAAESDVYNVAPISFLERDPQGGTDDAALAYNKSIAEDPEPFHSQTYGLRRASTVDMDAICLRDVAMTISKIRARRWTQKRNAYRFSLPMVPFARLEPFDLVTLPVAGTTKTVWLRSVKESSDHSRLELEGEDFLAGTSNALAHTTQSSDGWCVADHEFTDSLHGKAAQTWTPASIVRDNPTINVIYHAATSEFLSVAPLPGIIMRAEFGGSWTVATTSPGTANLPGTVASDGATAVVLGKDYAVYSTDGDVWTAGTLPVASGRYFIGALAHDTDVFVAAYITPTPTCGSIYSTDGGATWSNSTDWPAAWISSRASASDGTRIIFIGGETTDPDEFTYSDDGGQNWEPAAVLPGLAPTYTSIAYGAGRWVVVGDGVAAYSDDGVTWTAATIENKTWASVSFTGRIFVAIDSTTGATTIATSANGSTWKYYPFGIDPGITDAVYDVAWGPHGGAIVGNAIAAWSGPLANW